MTPFQKRTVESRDTCSYTNQVQRWLSPFATRPAAKTDGDLKNIVLCIYILGYSFFLTKRDWCGLWWIGYIAFTPKFLSVGQMGSLWLLCLCNTSFPVFYVCCISSGVSSGVSSGILLVETSIRHTVVLFLSISAKGISLVLNSYVVYVCVRVRVFLSSCLEEGTQSHRFLHVSQ